VGNGLSCPSSSDLARTHAAWPSETGPATRASSLTTWTAAASGRIFRAAGDEGRAGLHRMRGGGTGWRRSGRGVLRRCFLRLVFEQTLADVETTQISRDDALLTLVTGWMSHLGPATASQLGEISGCLLLTSRRRCLRMEASGTVLRGSSVGRLVELARLDSRVPAPHTFTRATTTRETSGASGGCWRGFTG
jgi:hypothetical protein